MIERTRATRRVDTVCLAVNKTHPVRHVCPTDVRVTCLSGTAWITTEADLRDVVLESGQAHDAARGARLFINGLPCCELRIAPHHDGVGKVLEQGQRVPSSREGDVRHGCARDATKSGAVLAGG